MRADLKAFEHGRKWFEATDEVLDYIENLQSVEYHIINEVLLAILRHDSQDSEIDHCPFCGERHMHEGNDGRYEVACLSPRLDGRLTVLRADYHVLGFTIFGKFQVELSPNIHGQCSVCFICAVQPNLLFTTHINRRFHPR